MNIFSKVKGIFLDKPTKILKKQLIENVNFELANATYTKKLLDYPDKGKNLTAEQKAIIFAQCVQLQFLKSPSSAIFPEFDEFKVEKQDNTYIVSGYYDAENSYGGMGRDIFKINLINLNDLYEYTVDEDIVLKMVYTMYITVAIILGMIILVTI